MVEPQVRARVLAAGRSRVVVLCCLAIVAVALGGCGEARNGASSASSARNSTSGSSTNPAFSTATDVTTINGTVPEGQLLPLQDVKTMLDTVDANGNRLVVVEGTRRAGTRVAIHVHKYGGHTCVRSGQITDFVEGHEPMVWPAGTCYYMPPNTLMSAANLGTEDAVLIDTFILPPGEPTITIREPGWPPE